MDKYIFFDLDGTLLFMDQDEFVVAYYKLLYKKFATSGFDGKKCADAIIYGVEQVIKNNGDKLNVDVFWDSFFKVTGLKYEEVESLVDEFYKDDFSLLQNFVKVNKYGQELIKFLKENNYKIILATNPVFPQIATYTRVKWAGFNVEDFEYITTYENSKFCKPNPKYYQELINKFNVNPCDTWMIGNDMNEDGVTKTLGFKCLLTTDNLIDKKNKYDVEAILPWSEVVDYLKNNLK